jgi:hypothetical protein
MTLRALIAASFLVVAGLCRAQGVAYTTGDISAVDGSQMVYQLNLASRTVTPVGSSGSTSNGTIILLNGLTFGTDGNLYAIAAASSASQPALVTLSRTLGKATVVSQISGLPSSASAGLSLAFSCDGHLWMASSDSGNFWELTPGTGQTRLVGNLGVKITGLAVRVGVLYGAGGNGNANLYTIATDTAAVTAIGPYGQAAPNPVDAAFDGSGTLWSLLHNANDNGGNLPSQPNVLAQIDPASGAMNSLGNIANPPVSLPFPAKMRGLAIAPPSSCSDPPPPPPSDAVGAPALSPVGLGVFILSLLAVVFLAPAKQRLK